MRINKLIIKEFKNLHDFFIDFDEESFSTVIVGQNGSGKSNLLEAIVIIFRDLDLGKYTTFKYEIYYTCRNFNIHVDADPQRKKRVLIWVDGENVSYARFKELGRDYYLPNYVFGYYSGTSNRMEKNFREHQERFYRDLLNNISKPLRPLLYARNEHSQFVLLAFFYEKDKKILEFLKEYLGIVGLDSVLFILRDPRWDHEDERGDSRFWYSRGIVKNFLSKLYDLSLAPIRIKQEVDLGLKNKANLEHLYLYLRDEESLRKLAKEYASPQEFFKALESTYISKLISDVRIKVKIKNSRKPLTFIELSEGEQQLLMVLGLLRFTNEDESLFLLDEPDTHLNPAWSIQYVELLNNIISNKKNSHIIMTSHDPLVISSLRRSQVRIMYFEKETNSFFADMPEIDPVKMGYPEILTSDLFGLRSALNSSIQKYLDEKRELSIKEKLSERELERLSEVNEILDEFDITYVRDPFYEQFVKEMTKMEHEEKLQKVSLTKSEQERKERMAYEIIKKIKSEGAK